MVLLSRCDTDLMHMKSVVPCACVPCVMTQPCVALRKRRAQACVVKDSTNGMRRTINQLLTHPPLATTLTISY